jgi:hypothetical protein
VRFVRDLAFRASQAVIAASVDANVPDKIPHFIFCCVAFAWPIFRNPLQAFVPPENKRSRRL